MAFPVLPVLGIILFCGLSFLFALAETALFALGRWQVERLAESAGAAGKRVERLLKLPEELLSTIVLGNAFANAAVVALVLWIAEHRSWELWAALLVMFALLFILGEMIPKTLAIRDPEAWSVRVAGPMVAAMTGLSAFREGASLLGNSVLKALIPATLKPLQVQTEAEYKELLELATQQGTLGQNEREIILQVLQLDQRTVREVMLPRSQMKCIPDDLSLDEMLKVARTHRFHRLPIYDGDVDTMVGILNARQLLENPKADLSEVIEFPSFVPESMNLMQLLQSLQRQRRGMAMVLDEFGSTAGLVTMGDILGLVTGQVRDWVLPGGLLLERVSEGKWRAGGAVRLDDLRREYPAIGEVPEVETIGGLLLLQLDTVPSTGTTLNYRGLKFTVTAAEERRVLGVLIERIAKA